MRRDVRLTPPAANWFVGRNGTQEEIRSALEPPSPQEIIQAQDVEIRRLSSELEKTKVVAGTIANAAVVMTHMLLEAQDNKGRELHIDRTIRNRLDGAQIKVRTDPDGDIYVSYEGGEAPIWDGRTDD